MDERERRILNFMLTGFPRIVISVLLLAIVFAVLWAAGAFK